MDTLAEARRAEKSRRKKERKARERAFAKLSAEFEAGGLDETAAEEEEGLSDEDPGVESAEPPIAHPDPTEMDADRGASDEWVPRPRTSVSLVAAVIAADMAAEEEAPVEVPTELEINPVASFDTLTSRTVGGGPLLGQRFVDGVLKLLIGKATRRPGNEADAGAAVSAAEPALQVAIPTPTPIQAAAWGALLQRHPPDVVAIAPTGSGKTLAFLLPVVARALTMATPEPAPAVASSVADADAAAISAARARAREAATRVFTKHVKQGESQTRAKELAKEAYTRALRERNPSLPPTASIARPAHLVLSPTRELCLQIQEVLKGLLQNVAPMLRGMAVIGGEGYAHQAAAIQRCNPHFVVATPGRLLSQCGHSKSAEPLVGTAAEATPDAAVCTLSAIETLILDEADMLLDLGFEEAIVDIFTMVPREKWTMLFSATFPPAVRRLAGRVVSEGALYIAIGNAKLAAADTVQQRVEVLRGKGAPRFRRLCALLTEFGATITAKAGGDDDGNDGTEPTNDHADGQATKVLVFVLYKKEARDVGKSLRDRGFSVVSLSGSMSQNAREASLRSFHDGHAQVMVATDVAARGLDIQGITHVVNFSLGTSIERFVHRVGRCGRAGRTGIAYSFIVDGDEHLLDDLIAVMHRTRQRVPSEVYELATKYREQQDRQLVKQMRGLDEDAEALEEARRENEEKQRLLRDAAAQRAKGHKGGHRGKKKK